MDIEEESRLAGYTDSHFVHQMNLAMMDQFRDRSNSNSPVTLSNSSSDYDIESAKFRKLTYKELCDHYSRPKGGSASKRRR
jgi:hypothetical protein